MFPVGDEYNKMLETNIRYKCQPKITVGWVDNDKKYQTIKFTSSQIKDLNYTYSIDPLSRELPYIELTWTEAYSGKIDQNGSIFKYRDVGEHAQVDFVFEQDLSRYNTWGLIYGQGENTWKSIYEKYKTWKNVRNNAEKQVFRFPRVFLADNPKVDGNVVKWTARDVLHFCDHNTYAVFEKDEEKSSFKDLINYILDFEKATYTNYYDPIYDFLGISGFKLAQNENISNFNVLNRVGLDGKTRDLLKKSCSFGGDIFMTFPAPDRVQEWFMDFSIPPKYTDQPTKKIPLKFMYKTPTILKQGGVTGFKNVDYSVVGNANSFKIEKRGETNYTSNAFVDVGSEFFEDNNLSTGDQSASVRVGAINFFIPPNSVIADLDILHDLSIENGDLVQFETNTYKENEYGVLEPVCYNGVVVKISLYYNGAIKQKLTINSVDNYMEVV